MIVSMVDTSVKADIRYIKKLHHNKRKRKHLEMRLHSKRKTKQTKNKIKPKRHERKREETGNEYSGKEKTQYERK